MTPTDRMALPLPLRDPLSSPDAFARAHADLMRARRALLRRLDDAERVDVTFHRS